MLPEIHQAATYVTAHALSVLTFASTYHAPHVCACELQEPIIADVSKVQHMMEPLLSYHPFWLRLGLLIVTKDAAAAAAAVASGGQGAAGGMDAAMRRGLQVCVGMWVCVCDCRVYAGACNCVCMCTSEYLRTDVPPHVQAGRLHSCVSRHSHICTAGRHCSAAGAPYTIAFDPRLITSAPHVMRQS